MTVKTYRIDAASMYENGSMDDRQRELVNLVGSRRRVDRLQDVEIPNEPTIQPAPALLPGPRLARVRVLLREPLLRVAHVAVVGEVKVGSRQHVQDQADALDVAVELCRRGRGPPPQRQDVRVLDSPNDLSGDVANLLFSRDDDHDWTEGQIDDAEESMDRPPRRRRRHGLFGILLDLHASIAEP